MMFIVLEFRPDAIGSASRGKDKQFDAYQGNHAEVMRAFIRRNELLEEQNSILRRTREQKRTARKGTNGEGDDATHI